MPRSGILQTPWQSICLVTEDDALEERRERFSRRCLTPTQRADPPRLLRYSWVLRLRHDVREIRRRRFMPATAKFQRPAPPHSAGPAYRGPRITERRLLCSCPTRNDHERVGSAAQTLPTPRRPAAFRPYSPANAMGPPLAEKPTKPAGTSDCFCAHSTNAIRSVFRSFVARPFDSLITMSAPTRFSGRYAVREQPQDVADEPKSCQPSPVRLHSSLISSSRGILMHCRPHSTGGTPNSGKRSTARRFGTSRPWDSNTSISTAC